MMQKIYNLRRPTVSVQVGNVTLGSEHPIAVQSMTNTDTLDVERSAEQCRRIADAGADIVRLTAQGVRHAESIGMIRNLLHKQGCYIPLVADIHFNPQAALAAAALTDKVRINPGNFADPARTFRTLEYTDEQYKAELDKIRTALLPLIAICRDHHTALRLGINHGSLSDRIMSRYGNTPQGMVESAMEYLRILVEQGFTDVVLSMKASNVVVMVESVRRLVAAMDAEDMHFPLHLGVTEAGFGEDGRIKSAVGIGTLLCEGLGDTIRVSLSEEPECEIPVARKLLAHIASRRPVEVALSSHYDSLCVPQRKPTVIAGMRTPIVMVNAPAIAFTGSLRPDVCDTPPFPYVVASADEPVERFAALSPDTVVLLERGEADVPATMLRFLHRYADLGGRAPVVAVARYDDADHETLQVKAAADLGPVVMSGLVDGIGLEACRHNADSVAQLAFGILQAARLRTTKTELISCPGCGRTLFDLQTTARQVQQATAKYTHLKIAVMGCIVNGPGEMADADYGYVGAGPGRVSLYRGKQCIEKNIPQTEAIPRLLALIEQYE